MPAKTNTAAPKGGFNDKEEYVTWLRGRTKEFAVRTIRFCEKLPLSQANRVIVYQLIKSATSVAANYRAACRARSGAEFFSKMCIVVEESDESVFWYEIMSDLSINTDQEELLSLLDEARQITALMATTRKNIKVKRNT